MLLLERSTAKNFIVAQWFGYLTWNRKWDKLLGSVWILLEKFLRTKLAGCIVSPLVLFLWITKSFAVMIHDQQCFGDLEGVQDWKFVAWVLWMLTLTILKKWYLSTALLMLINTSVHIETKSDMFLEWNTLNYRENEIILHLWKDVWWLEDLEHWVKCAWHGWWNKDVRMCQL